MVVSALVCLALTIHAEARGEPREGKIAVASVVLNRVDHNDSDVCTEVVKPGQFPWARRTLRKTRDGYALMQKALPSGTNWDSALELAGAVLAGDVAVMPNITSFHGTSERPGWKLRRQFAIGGHVFYGPSPRALALAREAASARSARRSAVEVRPVLATDLNLNRLVSVN
ncbi:MAG: cell wall hydrolase [Rhodocyclaceae bacterium]|nr:cell wall hydrolase [Rhodocyclaceae bacterium]MBX3668045.1 cell wall hydrolase [Rhodocyclaceae bacterium]